MRYVAGMTLDHFKAGVSGFLADQSASSDCCIRLVRAIVLRRVAPPEPIAIDEDDAAQNAPVINALSAMALRKMGPKTRATCSSVSQYKSLILQARCTRPESLPSPHINGSRPYSMLGVFSTQPRRAPDRVAWALRSKRAASVIPLIPIEPRG